MESGLRLRRKITRKRWRTGKATPAQAEHANHLWAYDFVHDACRDGQQFKTLTIVDEYTRECLTVKVGHRMLAGFVCQTLMQLFAGHDQPAYVRSDNGPEFLANALMRMLATEQVGVEHIEPGSPLQNGKNERFNGSVRDECLNLETFEHRDLARAVCHLYQRH